MTNEEIVEEILYEACEMGILSYVLDKAKELLDTNPKIDRVIAYQTALSEYTKLKDE